VEGYGRGAMPLRFDTISFLSDYGRTDEFVGVVHSVVRALSPGVEVIDITHEVPAYDVRAGGLTLARSVQYLCSGVVMAIVDPGVGSSRRPIAVEVGDGASVLVGPDNGVLAPAVAMVGGATRAVCLNNDEHHLEAPGPLFAGRDVFAPVAAAVCRGVPFDDLGDLIEPAGLMPGIFPLSETTDEGLTAEVLWVDRYGNAQLNVDPDELDPMGSVFELRCGGMARTARRVHSFSEIETGAVGLVIDSYGFIALAAQRSSAAQLLEIGPSSPVTLVPYDDDGRPDQPRSESVTTPVNLSRSPDGTGREGVEA
jgi:S-adenosyl-L-methionine hydrolase (adenosine-forming)